MEMPVPEVPVMATLVMVTAVELALTPCVFSMSALESVRLPLDDVQGIAGSAEDRSAGAWMVAPWTSTPSVCESLTVRFAR